MKALDQGGELLHCPRDRLRTDFRTQQTLQNLAGATGAAAGKEDILEHLVHLLPEPLVTVEHAKPQGY